MSSSNLQEIIDLGLKLTPMMEQYYNIKKQLDDHVLLFRMGDFYELFFEDAHRVSKILNLALTHRGKIGSIPIPMAGIPHHSISNYADRLTQKGLKVAICEQVEDPKNAKKIVKREITQIISPGIPYNIEQTRQKENYYITCAYQKDKNFFLTIIDFTTGKFFGKIFKSINELVEYLTTAEPREFMSYMGQWDHLPIVEKLIKKQNILQTYLSQEYFNPKYTYSYIEKFVPNFKIDNTLKNNKNIIPPLGAITYYVCSTKNANNLKHIDQFKLKTDDKTMNVNYKTLTGLEILPIDHNKYKQSLLGFMDKTKTAMGARRLRELFLNPLISKEKILTRQKLVHNLKNNTSNLEYIREHLCNIYDLERLLTKISTKRANNRDLINLVSSIESFFSVKEKCTFLSNKKLFKIIELSKEKRIKDVISKIKIAINDEIGATAEKGNLIKKGYNKNRDQLASLNTSIADKLLKLESFYRKETNISKLKIRSNNVFGFFIEITKSQSHLAPKNFKRKQTLTNGERFTTDKLANFEKEIIVARDNLEKIENNIFDNIIKEITDTSHIIKIISENIAFLDAMSSISWVCYIEEFICPKIEESKKIIDLKNAWHPLIKQTLKQYFVPHSICLNEKTFMGLITGPNMAGKTTVMREIAIVQILSQIGSFVPAENANLGICDYIFSRLGANDDIQQGYSTFMVEMSETAEILRHATSKSLIILDEIGRGTSTHDGLSIAWALIEYLINNIKGLTLFATHYHELVDLVEKLPQAKNFTIAIDNKSGEIQFLYQLINGHATESFGVEVAKMAGLPINLLKRAKNILNTFERSPRINTKNKKDNQELSTNIKKIIDDINKTNTLEITPINALKKLDDFKKIILKDLH